MMTKEELEKEAITQIRRLYSVDKDKSDEFISEYFDTEIELYLASAKPRKKQIAVLGERNLQLQKDKGNLTDRVRELEQEIEEMKNCKNCKKLKKEKDGLLICTVGSFYTNTFGKNCDKWEIKEND